MEKFKKHLFIFVSTLIFLVAVVATLNMMNGQEGTVGLGNRNVKTNDRNLAYQEINASGEEAVAVSNVRGMVAPVAMEDGYAAKNTAGMVMEESFTPDMPPVETEKKEIKNGSLNLQVGSVDKTAERIAEIAKSNGGEVFSSNFAQAKNNIRSGNLTVRVPVADFEKTFSDLKKVAVLVVRESTSGQDVTMEYADLQARVKNKQAEEQAYLDILKQATKIQDILEVTQSLSGVRGEIESLQGQIKFMDSQTDMSTISIFLTEDVKVAEMKRWRPLQVAIDTVNGLLQDMQGFINFLIVLIIRVIPLMALYGVILFLIYLGIKRIFFKKKQ